MSFEMEYIQILKEELLPAMGCTEPIAIAYAAAIARDTLHGTCERMEVHCSGNVVKNVKGVTIPNTNGLKGIEAAAIAGVVAGKKEKIMEVISEVSDEEKDEINRLVKTDFCKVVCLHDEANLFIRVRCMNQEHQAYVELMHTHTNVTKIVSDDEMLYENICDSTDFNSVLLDRSCLSVERIVDFGCNGNIDEVKPLLRQQIEYNVKIAEEGLKNSYGANVGQIIRSMCSNEYRDCIAYASAGSDARMSGCKLAVMTNSGSGNQGITTSLPVIVYARQHQMNEEKMLRALVISNLITIRIKTGIGRLSAYCGVVCAAAGSFAGIAYLEGYGLDVISKMISNHLGTVSGMVCDGAKESCASKISTALFSAMLSLQLAKQEIAFCANSGIIQEELEKTIDAIGYVGRVGMKETDKVILDIMTKGKE